VRNAANGIVQLAYGEDGMDPLVMEEDNGRPINLARMLAHVRATIAVPPAMRREVLLPDELRREAAALLEETGLSAPARRGTRSHRPSLGNSIRQHGCAFKTRVSPKHATASRFLSDCFPTRNQTVGRRTARVSD
jgi:hypothetical protein